MTRLIFWIALFILVVWAVRSKVRAMMAPYRDGAAPGPAAGTQGAAAAGRAGSTQRQVRDDAETMACCAACGIYFPASEAVRLDGRDYCSTAHASKPSLHKADGVAN